METIMYFKKAKTKLLCYTIANSMYDNMRDNKFNFFYIELQRYIFRNFIILSLKYAHYLLIKYLFGITYLMYFNIKSKSDI